MEQIAIITQLFREINEMNCDEMERSQFILNLDGAVNTLTSVTAHIKRKMARDLKWEEGREERERIEKEKQEIAVKVLEKKIREERERMSAQDAMLYGLRIGDRFSFQPIMYGKVGGMVIEGCEVISKTPNSFLVRFPCSGDRRCYKKNMYVVKVVCREEYEGWWNCQKTPM